MEKKIVERKIHEEKAFKIVTRLAVETVDAESLLKLVRFIEPFHYEEIVEERYLVKLCGYALCSNQLVNIPTQKYKISTKANMVYELADRKRFCSPSCFRSSKYLQEQISTTPVWLRHSPENAEESKREIKLLSIEKKLCANGKEATDTSVTNVKATRLQLQEPTAVTIAKGKHMTEIENDLNRVEQAWREKFKLVPQNAQSNFENNIYKKLNINEKTYEIVDDSSLRSDKTTNATQERNKLFKKPNDFELLRKLVQEDTDEDDKWLATIKAKLEDESNAKNLLFIEYVLQRLNSLLSKKTRDYIAQNNSQVQTEREREEFLEKCDKYVTSQAILFDNLKHSDDLIPITTAHASDDRISSTRQVDEADVDDMDEAEMRRKIEFLENMIDRTSAKTDLSEQVSSGETLSGSVLSDGKKPLPDYEQLRKEMQTQELKVREFFLGKQRDHQATNNIDDQDEDDLEPGVYKRDIVVKIKETNEEVVRVLPTVDSKSQIIIRRKIFYEKLIKYMEQVLKFSDFNYAMTSNTLKSHVKNFVFSLNLTNENMIFGTNEWPIISIFVLQILSLKKSNVSGESLTALETLVNEDKLIECILNSFKIDRKLFQKLCSYVVFKLDESNEK